MMHIGINAGFGQPLGEVLMRELYNRGFRVIRQRYPDNDDDAETIIRECEIAGIRPLWITESYDVLRLLPDNAWVEWGNEPDLNNTNISEYLSTLLRAYDIGYPRLRLSPGGISNLNNRGFTYLEQIMRYLPRDAPVAIHRYPNWNGPTKAHTGFRSRAHEYTTLQSIIQSRPLWVTEIGYHTAPQKVWWFFKSHWDNMRVAEFAQWERNFWTPTAELFCWYQLNDGISNTYLNRYGIRDFQGLWKPVSEKFR